VTIVRNWLLAAVVLKLVLVFAAFPYYQEHYRGRNFETAALDIQRRAASHALYTAADNASGLSVTAHLDLLRLPAPPLTLPPEKWDSGFVVTHKPDSTLGQIAAEYRLGGNVIYLMCRGSACTR